MKDILLIGGPSTLSGVDRINDDLLSILTEPHLYDRKAVIVWPTPDFLEPPTDTEKLQPYVDMNDARWQVIDRRGMAAALKGLTSEQIKNLATTAKLDHKALCDAFTQEAISQGVFRLAKLLLLKKSKEVKLVVGKCCQAVPKAGRRVKTLLSQCYRKIRSRVPRREGNIGKGAP